MTEPGPPSQPQLEPSQSPGLEQPQKRPHAHQVRLLRVREHMTRDNARFVSMTILPVAIALLSFDFSLYSIIAAREAPDVVMTMPDRVRIAQGGSSPWLYIQPRFVNTGDNNRNEIIQHLTVEVVPVEGGTPTPFNWDEQGSWLYNTQTFQLAWQFVADPAPIVVGQNDPQFPLGLFIGPTNSPWQATTYRVTVIADRTIQHEPLQGTVEFTLTPEFIAIVADQDGPFLVEVPTDPVSYD
jgi:hypothetical protein